MKIIKRMFYYTGILVRENTDLGVFPYGKTPCFFNSFLVSERTLTAHSKNGLRSIFLTEKR